MDSDHKQEMDKVIVLSQKILKQLQIDNYDIERVRELRKENKTQQFPPLQNNAFLQAMKHEKQEHIPVWIMRQAGRYLSEFQSVRKQYSFFEICDNPILSCEITLQPINIYRYDASIIFSDILIIPKALGLEVQMVDKKGPVFPSPLESPDDLQRLVPLSSDTISCLDHVYDAIYLTRMALEGKVPLIGFCGTPWTLMTYMVEGGSSKLFSKVKRWIYQWPQHSHTLLQLLTDTCIQYLSNCIQSGAQSIQIFDSNCCVLERSMFMNFSLQYVQKITDALKTKYPETPITYFMKDQQNAQEECFQIESIDTYSVDSTVDKQKIKGLAQKYNKTIQGNMDPAVLYSSDEQIQKTTKEMIDFWSDSNYIVNLGQGIWPDMDRNKVEVFVECVKSHK